MYTPRTFVSLSYLSETINKNIYTDIVKFRTMFGLPIKKRLLRLSDYRLLGDLFCEELGELSTVKRDVTLFANTDDLIRTSLPLYQST
jgi:hypothetical protein